MAFAGSRGKVHLVAGGAGVKDVTHIQAHHFADTQAGLGEKPYERMIS